MALTSHIAVQVRADHTDVLDLSTVLDALDLRTVLDWASGTGASQADLIWHDSRSTDTDGETIDLAGSLTDVFGTAVSFAEVKLLLIRADADNTGNVLVGGGSFVNWVANSTDIVVVKPGGLMLLVAPGDGYAVTAGTGDGLFIDSSSGTVAYDIVIIGTSA